jgi:hypothetical protein
MAASIPRHLPPAALSALQGAGGVGALTSGAALDPARLGQLPAAIQDGIRAGMADALHQVYLAGLPFLAVALLASLLIREVPLRRSTRTEPAPAPAAEELAPTGTGE